MKPYDHRLGVMIYDFTGLPLEEGETKAAFEVAVRYVQTSQSGIVEFLHDDAEGTIESKGADRMGETSGWRFEVDFGGKREIEFLFPYRCEDVRVPKEAVVFRKLRKVSVGGKARSLQHKGNKTIN